MLPFTTSPVSRGDDDRTFGNFILDLLRDSVKMNFPWKIDTDMSRISWNATNEKTLPEKPISIYIERFIPGLVIVRYCYIVMPIRFRERLLLWFAVRKYIQDTGRKQAEAQLLKLQKEASQDITVWKAANVGGTVPA